MNEILTSIYQEIAAKSYTLIKGLQPRNKSEEEIKESAEKVKPLVETYLGNNVNTYA
jgi:hypothetical protein